MGILMPLTIPLANAVGIHTGLEGNELSTYTILNVGAVLTGAIFGDHCSPISDTTIMASAGAQCNHMNHVSTQLPYVIVVAVISCVTYVIAGFVQNPVVPLIIGLVILIGAFTGIKYINKGKSNE
jgi:Na+/H+ antiporter NhaC